MTRDELSMLLYLETCAVDQGGLVEGVRCNEKDLEIAQRWDDEGFLHFGRLKFRDIERVGNRTFTHWVRFTDKAWEEACSARRGRSARKEDDKVKEIMHERQVSAGQAD